MFFFFFAYFADVFNSSMWTDLRSAVPQGDDALFSLADSLSSQMWLWLAELPVLHPSIPLPTADGSLGHMIMA